MTQLFRSTSLFVRGNRRVRTKGLQRQPWSRSANLLNCLNAHYKALLHQRRVIHAVVELLIERIKPITAIQFIPNYDFSVQLEHLAKSAMTLLNDEDYMRLSRIVMIESMRSYERAQNLNENGHCEAAMIQWFDDAARAGCLGHYDADFAASYFGAR